MSSQLFKIKMSNLIKLGYKNPELQWLNNSSNLLIKNKYNNTIYHKHFPDLSYDIKYNVVLNNLKTSGFPQYLNDIYTATIMTSILHYGFDSWANYNVHLNYYIILDTDICPDSKLDSIKLLSHQFVKPAEYAQLQHFRNIQRDSKICPTDIHQLMMSIDNKKVY
jgi:hypothetical protein